MCDTYSEDERADPRDCQARRGKYYTCKHRVITTAIIETAVSTTRSLSVRNSRVNWDLEFSLAIGDGESRRERRSSRPCKRFAHEGERFLRLEVSRPHRARCILIIPSLVCPPAFSRLEDNKPFVRADRLSRPDGFPENTFRRIKLYRRKV